MMPSTRGWTERPREPLLQLDVGVWGVLSRIGGKEGLSDPAVESGIAVAQRIKGIPGITGLSFPRVHIDGRVWHLDVGSSHPGAGAGPKGWAVRPLKRYASWVQNVVRQFGPY